jgi:hypothetical protein
MTAQSPFFQMRVNPEEREGLRVLAAEEGKSQTALVKDLVRAAIEHKAQHNARLAALIFGSDESPDAVA